MNPFTSRYVEIDDKLAHHTVDWHCLLNEIGRDFFTLNAKLLEYEPDHVVCHVIEMSSGFYPFISIIRGGKDGGGHMGNKPYPTHREALGKALKMAADYREYVNRRSA